MEWLLRLPELLEDNIPRLKRLRDQHRFVFQGLLLVIGVTILCWLGSFYLLYQPTTIISSYFRAVNDKNWEAANALLVPPLARDWSPETMAVSYNGLVGQETVDIHLASSDSHIVIKQWLYGELFYDVDLEYRVQLRPGDVQDSRRHRDTLWAQIVNEAKFNELQRSPSAEPMQLTIVEVRRWHLRRYGLQWRIVDWQPIRDGIKYMNG